MSDRTPSRRSAWVLASIVLGVAFFAGLPMYVGRDADTPTISAVSGETNGTADIPVSSTIETPPDAIDRQTDRAAMDAVLTDMQNKIQQLEDDVVTLQEHRKRIDDILIRQADRSTQESVSATTPPAPVEAVSAVDRAGLDEALAHLGALATEQGHLITLGEPELSFKVDGADFASEPPGVLEEIAKVLMRYEHMLARIEGHSDSKGYTQHNQQLTQDRAQAVREALSDKGIDPDRIQAEGLGGIRPVTDNRTIAARERNRRIEIYLIEP